MIDDQLNFGSSQQVLTQACFRTAGHFDGAIYIERHNDLVIKLVAEATLGYATYIQAVEYDSVALIQATNAAEFDVIRLLRREHIKASKVIEPDVQC